MRKHLIAGVAAVALMGGGVVAGMSLAEGDAIGEPRDVAAPAVVAPVTGVARGGAVARRGSGGPTIDFFYARNDIVPANGAGLVQPIRCPRGAGKPIAGGARTGDGVVLAYLSRAHPETGRTPRRTYFVGVEDVDLDPDTNPGAGALVEVQCAKGMRVKN
jgi:hypothetical protein